MNYIERCHLAINQLVEEEVKAVQDFINQELQPPTKEQLSKMIAEREIKAMHLAEEEAGIATMD